MKVLVIVRATNENSLNDCIGQLKQLDFDLEIMHNDDSLEKKTKKIIRRGAEVKDKYDWLMVVSADIIVTKSKSSIENICKRKTKKDSFFFGGAVAQTWSNYITTGVLFYRTNACDKAYELIKDIDFSLNPGRAETMILFYLKEKGFMVENARRCDVIGIHLWFVNNMQKPNKKMPIWAKQQLN